MIDQYRNELLGYFSAFNTLTEGSNSGAVREIKSIIIPYLKFLLSFNFIDLNTLQRIKLSDVLSSICQGFLGYRCAYERLNSDSEVASVTKEEFDEALELIIKSFNDNKSFLDSIYTFLLVNDLNANFVNIKEHFSSLEKNVTTFEGEIKNSVNGLQILAGNIALPTYATVYETEAKQLSEVATRWLCGIGLLAITFILTIIYFMCHSISLPNWENVDPTVVLLSMLSLRITLIAFLFFCIYFAVHKYNVLKHNATLNRGKANAIKAFRGFVETTEHQDTRNTILLTITNYIFSTSATGYLKSQEIKDVIRESNSILSTCKELSGGK